MRRRTFEVLAELRRERVETLRQELAPALDAERALRARLRMIENALLATDAPPGHAALLWQYGAFLEGARRRRRELEAALARITPAIEDLRARLRQELAEARRYERLAERAAAQEREQREQRAARELRTLIEDRIASGPAGAGGPAR